VNDPFKWLFNPHHCHQLKEVDPMKDHATAPHYALLTNFDRLPKARLDALLAEVQARPPFEGYRLTI
jgi:hypothetical protein